MNEEKGVFGVLPRGPIRKALLDKEFKDRPFKGVLMKDTDEARSFRRNTASNMVVALVGAAYLGSIVETLRFRGFVPIF